MTVVASAGPPAPTPQPGGSPAASGATGGVFAALFGAIATGGDQSTTDSAVAAALGVIQGALGANTKPAAATGTKPDTEDDTPTDGGGSPSTEPHASTDATALMAALGVQPTPTIPPTQDLVSTAPLVEPSGAAAVPVLAPKGAKPESASSADADATPPGLAKQPQITPQGALPLPAGVLPDSTTVDQPRASATARDPGAAKQQAFTGVPAAAAALPPDDASLPTTDEAPGKAAEAAAPVGAKKPSVSSASAPSNTNATSSDTSTASASSTTAGLTLVTSATPDASILPLTSDPGAPVKTVSVSNLAGLSQQAAVTAIGAAIATQASGGTNRFIIRLDPPDLGRIDVRLHFDRDGELRAHLIADRPDTVSMLTRDAAALERTLNANGIRTSDAGIDVSLRDPSGGLAQNGGAFSSDTPASPYSPTAPAPADAPAANTFIWVRPQAAAGRLDLTV